MKTYYFIIVFICLCSKPLSAQTAVAITNRISDFDTRRFGDNWSFGIGVNLVNDSGTRFNDFLDFKENQQYNWAFVNPLTLSIEYYINPKFSIYTTASFNEFKSGKSIDGTVVASGSSPAFFALDFGTKYSFRSWIKSNVFDAYAGFGIGHTYVGNYINELDGTAVNSEKSFTVNPNLGINIWCTDRWGINMNAAVKLSFNTNHSPYSQYGLGVVYLLPFKYK